MGLLLILLLFGMAGSMALKLLMMLLVMVMLAELLALSIHAFLHLAVSAGITTLSGFLGVEVWISEFFENSVLVLSSVLHLPSDLSWKSSISIVVVPIEVWIVVWIQV